VPKKVRSTQFGEQKTPISLGFYSRYLDLSFWGSKTPNWNRTTFQVLKTSINPGYFELAQVGISKHGDPFLVHFLVENHQLKMMKKN
jgi:hypothetical protein